MNPFIHLPHHRVIICQTCKYAVLPNNVDSYLRHPKRHKYNKQQRNEVIREVSRIEGLIHSASGLEAFVFPDPGGSPIPELQAAHHDGLQCKACNFMCRHERWMREHCVKEHQWENERKRGRPLYKKRQCPSERPWRTGVHCQQFFIQGPKSQFFEAKASEGETAARPAEVDKLAIVRRVTRQRFEKIQKEEKESIDVADENAEPNPWLMRVLWHKHLEGKNARRLRRAIEPADASANASEERELGAVIESFRRVVSAAQEKGVRDVVGIHAHYRQKKTQGKGHRQSYNSDIATRWPSTGDQDSATGTNVSAHRQQSRCFLSAAGLALALARGNREVENKTWSVASELDTVVHFHNHGPVLRHKAARSWRPVSSAIKFLEI